MKDEASLYANDLKLPPSTVGATFFRRDGAPLGHQHFNPSSLLETTIVQCHF